MDLTVMPNVDQEQTVQSGVRFRLISIIKLSHVEHLMIR